MTNVRALSDSVREALENNRTILMRIIKYDNVIERVFVFSGFYDGPNESFAIYKEDKTTFFNGRTGISHNTLKEEKDMGYVSTIANSLNNLLFDMEKAGYQHIPTR